MLGHRDPYISFMQDDFHESDGVVQVDLTEDSVTRRIWEYDQNDAIRYFARVNPLGSEEKFLEQRGERFGEALYTAFDDFLDGQEDVFMYPGQGWKKVDSEPGAAARQALYSLGNGSEQEFYCAAQEAVEELAFEESLAAKSEI
ncbi:MAG: hypothetical protein ABEJ36_05050 [Candidatus Nanosalina sp.]